MSRSTLLKVQAVMLLGNLTNGSPFAPVFLIRIGGGADPNHEFYPHADPDLDLDPRKAFAITLKVKYIQLFF
jgi:hypothetical protein